MVKEFLPALRAKAAKALEEKHHINQQQIGRLLDTTQAAVSKYLSGIYSKRVKEMEKELDDKDIEDFVGFMLKNDKYNAQKAVCRMCSKNLTFRCALMIK